MDQNHALEDSVNIQGTLLMLDSATPHVAVPVQAMCNGEVAATVLSDERGKYQFINLKRELYQVRCHVLGGYVYYGEEKARSSFLEKSLIKKGPENQTMSGEPISLRVEPGETLRNIDFRFAPFKKGTWKNYDYLAVVYGKMDLKIGQTQ